MFVNYSNHSSKLWNDTQLEAAGQYGTIYDVAFPEVLVTYTEYEIECLSEEELKKLEQLAEEKGKNLNQITIMCQGEFSLTYAMVSRIKAKYPGCRVLCAVSERQVVEEREGMNTVKKVIFSFSGFREYK